MTVDEQAKLRNLQSLWLSQLNDQLTAISVPVKPAYLRDTVTKMLHDKGEDIICTNIALEWYLEQHSDRPLDPKNIVDAIIEHKGWNWDEVPHLRRNSNYYITVDSDDDELQDTNGISTKKHRRTTKDFDVIRNAIDFIESFPATPGIETLDVRLQNDIKVADEVLAWRSKDTDTYDYRQQFQIFLNRLQTLPDNAKQITFADIDEAIVNGVDYAVQYRRDDSQSHQPSNIILLSRDGTFKIIR